MTSVGNQSETRQFGSRNRRGQLGGVEKLKISVSFDFSTESGIIAVTNHSATNQTRRIGICGCADSVLASKFFCEAQTFLENS